MLNAARDALREAGVPCAGDRVPPYIVRMSGNLVYLFHPEVDGAFYMVKVGVQTRLDDEYAGLVEGHAAFPRGVPTPLALSRHRGFQTLVTTGIAYEPLGPLPMRNPTPRIEHALRTYFVTARNAFLEARTAAHSRLIRAAFESLAPRLPSSRWQSYVDAIAVDADALPAIRQHGDFYVNNLGLRDDALVILDWEDFGRASLPGLDTALLLLSLDRFFVDDVRRNAAAGGTHAWILDAAHEGTGVSPALAMRLLPAYVALIASMKEEAGYGSAFALRALAALQRSLAWWETEAPSASTAGASA